MTRFESFLVSLILIAVACDFAIAASPIFHF